MRFRKSVSDRLKEWFKEATGIVLRKQILFHRALHSVNVVVRRIALFIHRSERPLRCRRRSV